MPEQSFLSLLNNHRILVSDGATGTNLIARGLPPGATPESWVLDQPENIVRLHQDFIDAGADIILTSTFSATALNLRKSSLEHRSEEINRTAVALAKKAVSGEKVFIAGSLGPLGELLKPFGKLEVEQAVTMYASQARTLGQAGVDLLVVETQFDLNEVKAAIQGIRSVSTLPLVVSLSYDRGRKTMMGVSPTKAASELNQLPVDILGINCGRSLDENFQNLLELRQVTTKPIWFKPNAGLPHLDANGRTTYDVTPEIMGAQVSSWIEAGAQIIGGCCGTTPEHLAMISQHARKQ